MTSQSQNPAQLFEDYFGPALFQPWAGKLVEAVSLTPGMRILDLACATGTIARAVAKSGSMDVSGLDFSPAMLDVARSSSAASGLSIQWIEGSADDMPFENGQFDVVLSQQGLQFFPEREKSAKEIYRVLKDGGRLVASVWQGLDVHPLYGKLFEAVAERLGASMSAVSLPFSMGDSEELRKYIESGGFEKISITEQELTVQFTEPARFVQLSVVAAAAAIPAFGAMEPEQRSIAAGDIAASLSDSVAEYVDGDFVSIHTAVNMVIAEK